jgi:aspartyl-tRNA(Asn)/glutamyl-tRNA(Gln) amidotransferase subunit A
VVPLTKSLDHVGTLTKTVIDAALVLQTIAGHDPGWSQSACEAPDNYLRAVGESAAQLRFATPGGGFFENLNPEVAELTHQAIAHLATLAIRVPSKVTVPRYAEIEAALWPEFLASNAELIAKRRELFGPILRGAVSSNDPSPSALGYLKAIRALEEARANADRLIGNDVDLLVMPTWKHLPMTVEERQRTWPTGAAPAPEFFLQELCNTQPFNILGVPAISVPCGVSHAGLPVGLQIVGKHFQEGKVLCMARAFEQAYGGRLRPKSFS